VPESLSIILFGVFLTLFVISAVTVVIWGMIAARRRREAMLELATRLGLDFRPGKDRTLANGFSFLNKLRKGSNRYAFNILEGVYHEQRVLAFDFHYETHSHSSKGGRRTHHHYRSFFILLVPHPFPELTLGPEGILSRFAQMVGYDDIDFESAEFSRAFVVRSKDKKFAYDVCNPRMIEYLLENRDLTLELEGPAIALSFNNRLAPPHLEYNLKRLVRVRSLLPDYLFNT
jgi:hypothetical protein